MPFVIRVWHQYTVAMMSLWHDNNVTKTLEYVTSLWCSNNFTTVPMYDVMIDDVTKRQEYVMSVCIAMSAVINIPTYNVIMDNIPECHQCLTSLWCTMDNTAKC